MFGRLWWVAVGVAAVLFWAAFFPGWGWLVWGAVPLVLWALQGVGWRRGLGRGWLFGFLFFLLEFTSLWALMPLVGPLTYALWVLLALYGSLFFAAFGAVGGRWSSPWVWAGAWALLEAARAAGPLAFTFGSIPPALVGSPFLAASAWGGPWLLTVAVVWCAGCLVHARRSWTWLFAAAVGPAVLFVLASVPSGVYAQGDLNLALVQPNIPKIEQIDYTRLDEHEAKYRRLLARVPAEIQLIVVPENALPWILENPEYLELFGAAARQRGALVLVGTAEFRREQNKIYNTVLALNAQGSVEGQYSKVHLVPFGEYVPWRPFWRRVGLGPIVDRFLPLDQTPGEAVHPIGPLGVMICFESTLPEIGRELVRQGAEILLTPTNDAWFGRTRILWEHYAMGALRAAETGRVFAQAGQTGISGAWDPRGKELGRLAPWTEGVLTLRVPTYTGLTPYARVGDGPVLAAGALLMLWGVVRKRK